MTGVREIRLGVNWLERGVVDRTTVPEPVPVLSLSSPCPLPVLSLSSSCPRLRFLTEPGAPASISFSFRHTQDGSIHPNSFLIISNTPPLLSLLHFSIIYFSAALNKLNSAVCFFLQKNLQRKAAIASPRLSAVALFLRSFVSHQGVLEASASLNLTSLFWVQRGDPRISLPQYICPSELAQR